MQRGKKEENMATKKIERYFLVNTNNGDLEEFTTKEDLKYHLESSEDFKEDLDSGNEYYWKAFKGVEVDIDAELEGVKVELTEQKYDY